MRKNQLVLALLVVSLTSCAASIDKVIKLSEPDMNRPATVMKSLSERRSTREFAAQELDLKDLSDLLWAANGINREDGRRTAPSAMNKQDVDIYVVMEKGAYIYDPAGHALNLVAEGDFRPAIAASQEFVLQAPTVLLLVTDLSRLGDPNEPRTQTMGAVDVGIVSQNISIFCSAAGLATVPRAWMEHDRIREALQLTESQQPLINHPVGYLKQ